MDFDFSFFDWTRTQDLSKEQDSNLNSSRTAMDLDLKNRYLVEAYVVLRTLSFLCTEAISENARLHNCSWTKTLSITSKRCPVRVEHLVSVGPLHSETAWAGPDLLIRDIGLSLGPQDPRGPSANCGTHRVNGRYMIIYIRLRQKFMF